MLNPGPDMSAEIWEVDAEYSKLTFSVRHLMLSKVRGRFSRWKATLRLDEQAPENSTAEVEIDAASISTGESDRDAYLRSSDFLDVQRFPTLKFRGKRFESVAGEQDRLLGDLTIREASREIVVAVRRGRRWEEAGGRWRARFSGTCTLDRREFGLTWSRVVEAGGFAVGDRVEVRLEVEAVKKEEHQGSS